jgi:hypothetical protein
MLRQGIEQLLANATKTETQCVKAIIAPHAGYAFSGQVAASAFACLEADREIITRIILVGPAHLVRFEGIATVTVDAFVTPLGSVPVDQQSINAIASLPKVVIRDDVHLFEHSLEVHLPFLQVTLAQFKIVPLVTGETSSNDVAEVVEQLWGGTETRFVVSSDLSHHHDYRTARQVDRATARVVERMSPEELGEERACGCVAVRGMLIAARRHHLICRTLALCNSGDTVGHRDFVVGYGAFAFSQN